MSGNHISDALPNKNIKKHRWKNSLKNRCMILSIHTRIIYEFLVIIQGSYLSSLVSYKDRTKKSSMDKNEIIHDPCMESKKLQPGGHFEREPETGLL